MSNDLESNSEATPELAAIVEAWKPPAWGGFQIPEGVTLAWGARAIYSIRTVDEKRTMMRAGKRIRYTKALTVASIDIPYDRMEMVGGSDIERKAFAKWLDKTAIPMLHKRCAKDFVTGDCEAVVTIRESKTGLYWLHASPRASYGYLYISAWKVPS